MKQYIGNPLSNTQVKLGAKFVGSSAVFFGFDQIDRHTCNTATSQQADKIFDMHVKNGSRLNKDDITNIWTVSKQNNIPRVDAFSDSIKSAMFKK